MMPGTLAMPSVESTGLVGMAPLVERRRAGEVFPRVPLGRYELTWEQTAVALYVERYWLSTMPSTEELLNAAERAANAYRPDRLDERLPLLLAAPYREASSAWNYAYRLCLLYWYENATAEILGQTVVMPALYASDLAVGRSRQATGRVGELDGYMVEGMARIGADLAVRLSQWVHLEFGPPWKRVPAADLPAEYLEAMPDRRRRSYCHQVAVNRQTWPGKPLLVSFDNGHHAIGTVPPICVIPGDAA
ncbi:hypothetical protein [Streptomyces buecherae]|uniref:Uncharacterized protein n=1 Tax=Streptomyces buecherae TaxID=2763006 RepID=A0A7H8NDB8_9ACTN|nr:hypothetical protein [Streptomyces buecherae]QKW52425.1 hypothetical protein HUT08_26070 [Streptomyces buecherae]